MRPLRAVVFYIAVVFVGGAVLAPWLQLPTRAFACELPRIAAAPFTISR